MIYLTNQDTHAATRACCFARGHGLDGIRVAACLVLLMMLAISKATADDLCGMTITHDVTLDHDLLCSGSGIIVGADHVTVGLNGHTISGTGEGAGITVTGRRSVKIEGSGTITNFRTGILVTASRDVKIEEVSAVENGLPRPPSDELASPNDGIRVIDSWRVKLQENIAARNGDDGINLVSTTDSEVEENTVEHNGHDGIRLDASDRNQITENVVDSNGDLVGFPRGCGIEVFGSKDNVIDENSVTENHTGVRLRALGDLASTGNTIKENFVSRSEGTDADRGGIHLRDASTSANQIEENRVVANVNGIGLSGGPSGNTFAENTIATNTCGVRGPTPGNIFTDNRFEDNQSDFCP